ncbi:MAG TPA: DUF2007 domain-containing protein [Rhizobiales bacterium]|nr:DUF2007 domain-containing protein [Hyphomicrobiales bacterium]
MKEVLRTTDPVLITAIEATLGAAGITCAVFDGNMSVLEGSVGALPRRVMVDDEVLNRAKRVLREAGLPVDE